MNDLKLLGERVSGELKTCMKQAMGDLDDKLFQMSFGVIEESLIEIGSQSDHFPNT